MLSASRLRSVDERYQFLAERVDEVRDACEEERDRACEALGGSILLDAFGVVALVAMTPLITIQLMGLSYRRKLRRHAAVLEEGTDEILEYDVSMYQTQEVKELG